MRSLGINWLPSFEFPAGSRNNYLYACGLLVGGIVGIDTLVTTPFAVDVPFHAEWLSYNNLDETSNESHSGQFDPSAIAERQFDCIYSDTTTWLSSIDGIDSRPHRPLGLEVQQRILGWTSSYTRRFMIIDMTIRNIGARRISKPVLGLLLRPRVWNYDRTAEIEGGGSIVGFTQTIPSQLPEIFDTLPIAWAADNDGNPIAGSFDRGSTTGALGLVVLRVPQGKMSFNWWTGYGDGNSWGPMKAGSRFPDYGSGGHPYGDRALYYLMSNGETDYDQVLAARDQSAGGWTRPIANAEIMRGIADGASIWIIQSYALDAVLMPGDSLSVSFALIAAAAFHTAPDNFARNFNANDPSKFIEGLDFTDLHTYARWADWIFDSPGVDTDGDGYAGKYHLTNCRGPSNGACDTVWYKGDGIPDWGGPKTPPSPPFEISTRPHAITLSWNGAYSETARDHFSRRRDFEGYRVYSARTNNPDEYALIASWDIPDNFRRIAYDGKTGRWKQISYPLTVAQWRETLDDPEFDPRLYTMPSFTTGYKDTVVDTVRDAAGNIVRIEDRLRYSFWEPQGPNHGNTYPDADSAHTNRIQQIAVRDTIIDEDTLQYGIYEMTIDNLNAAIPLWMAVTAFDHGDYLRDVESLEGGPNANAQFAFPVYSADVVSDSGLQVTVYPNPYKIAFADAFGNTTNYYAQGYEAYGQPMMNERERRIWFANLPDTATIRIYSLDGDLIREIHHPDPFLTRYSSIVGWDLISRNTQAVVSGIYIWRVDSRLGSQVGKIVIIK